MKETAITLTNFWEKSNVSRLAALTTLDTVKKKCDIDVGI